LEWLSEADAEQDRETNDSLDEQHLRVPESFWFNPDDAKEWRGVRLQGSQYEEILPNDQGRLWSEVVGQFLGVHEGWRRLFERAGNLVATDGEARQVAEAELVQRRHVCRQAGEELARLKEDEIRNPPA